MPTKPSFLLKLDRAREHLESFDQKARAWAEEQPYTIVTEPDPEPPPEPVSDGFIRRRFRLTRIDEVPDQFPLLIGDCLFNLRTALDHLALALARKGTPTITEQQIGWSEFPIFHAGPMDPNTERKKIGCIARAAQVAIKAMQPYHRGSGYKTDPLWQIHELNRIDKHRFLTVCVAKPWCISPTTKEVGEYVGIRKNSDRWNLQEFGYFISQPGDLKPDAILARWSALPADPNREIDLDPHLPLEIAFEKGGAIGLQPVVPALRALCDHVGNFTIPALSKFL